MILLRIIFTHICKRLMMILLLEGLLNSIQRKSKVSDPDLIQILNQFIIIELFIHFIFLLVNGILFFSLIIVTLDIKLLKDLIYQQKTKKNNCLKMKKIEVIFQIVAIFVISLIIGDLLLLITKIIQNFKKFK